MINVDIYVSSHLKEELAGLQMNGFELLVL